MVIGFADLVEIGTMSCTLPC